MGGPAFEPNDAMQRSASGRFSGLSYSPNCWKRFTRAAWRSRASGVSAGTRPSGGSTMSDVRYSPFTTATRSPASIQKLL